MDGRELSIGGVRLAVTERIERCRMVDVQQADVPAAPDLLKTIAAHRGLCAGVYADVVEPGTLSPRGHGAGLAAAPPH